MARRLLALALSAVFVVLTTSVWTQCTGWDSSAEGRHACCAHAGHETTPQGAADCCAGVEQSRSGNIAAHAFHLPPLDAVPEFLVPVLPPVSLSVPVSRLDPVQMESPPPLFVRHVSFLI